MYWLRPAKTGLLGLAPRARQNGLFMTFQAEIVAAGRDSLGAAPSSALDNRRRQPSEAAMLAIISAGQPAGKTPPT